MDFLVAILIVIGLVILASWAGAEEKKRAEKRSYHKELNAKLKKIHEKSNQKDVKAADEFVDKLIEVVEENKYKLLEERRKLVKKDSYGNESFGKWFGDPPLDESQVKFCLVAGIFDEFKKGIPYFWLSTVLKKIGEGRDVRSNADIFFKEWKNYCLAYPDIEDHIEGKTRKISSEDWYAVVANIVERKCRKLLDQPSSKNLKKDMSGLEFEKYCKSILEDCGWVVEDTPTTGDQGVDLIASIEDLRVCIQCKCFTKPVGNKAVQEVAAGMIHWNGTHSVVVGKSGFTKSAKALADSTNVILISDSELENLENLVL